MCVCDKISVSLCLWALTVGSYEMGAINSILLLLLI